MKNAKEIIALIQSKPQFSKLSKYKCIERIQNIFAPALQKMIKFAYIKNKTLFFVLNHPGAKQEFDNNIQSIKSALNFHMPQECQETPFDDIKAFVTHSPTKKFSFKSKEPQLYEERSTGNFSINIEDDELRTLVKSIRDIIQKENDDS